MCHVNSFSISFKNMPTTQALPHCAAPFCINLNTHRFSLPQTPAQATVLKVIRDQGLNTETQRVGSNQKQRHTAGSDLKHTWHSGSGFETCSTVCIHVFDVRQRKSSRVELALLHTAEWEFDCSISQRLMTPFSNILIPVLMHSRKWVTLTAH